MPSFPNRSPRADPAPKRSGHRWLLILLLPGLVIAAALGLRALLHPDRISAFLLHQTQMSTGLELTLERPADVGLWPDLHIQLTGLDALDVLAVADEEHAHVLHRTGLNAGEGGHDQIGHLAGGRRAEGQHVAGQHAAHHRAGDVVGLARVLFREIRRILGRQVVHERAAADAVHVLLGHAHQIQLPALSVAGLRDRKLDGGSGLLRLGRFLLALLVAAGQEQCAGNERDESNLVCHVVHLRS